MRPAQHHDAYAIGYGLTKQSLYELEKGLVGRGAYDRALESVDAVNSEILDLIRKVWGR